MYLEEEFATRMNVVKRENYISSEVTFVKSVYFSVCSAFVSKQ